MDLRTFSNISVFYFLAFVLMVSSATLGLQSWGVVLGEEEIVPVSTDDVIMKEDAQEIFYNLDFNKYEGMKCPTPEPPENGVIIGEGNEVGSVVYVECKEGFYLSGPTVMACSPGEIGLKWDPQVERKCNEGETYFQETNVQERHRQRMDSASQQPDEAKEEEITDEVEPPAEPDFNHFQFPRTVRRDPHEEELKAVLPYGEFGRRMELQALVPSSCHLKPEKGPCSASHLRYFFDVLTMECAEFFYGGCSGNENNFESVAECNHACLRKLP